MQNLVTLDQHNEMARRLWQTSAQAFPTGIMCPVCLNELVIPDPLKLLQTHPPRRKVKCPEPECAWEGEIIA